MKRARPLFLPLLLLATAAAAPEIALAQKPPLPADKASSERADALFRQGNALAKKDKWSEAEPLFREAWSLKHSYDIGGNLGIAEASLGKWRDAAEHLSFALDTFPANGKPEHRKLLEEKFKAARAQVAALTIKVDVEGATVSIDGVDIDPTLRRGVVFVDPGIRAVDAKLTGYSPARDVVRATAGATLEVSLKLQAPSAPPQPPKATPVRDAPVEKGSAVPGIGWIAATGAAAAVGLGVGIGLTVAANGKSSEADQIGKGLGPSACAGGGAQSTKCVSLHDALTAQGTMTSGAIAGFVIGGALAATTAGLGIWRGFAGGEKKLAPSVSAVIGKHEQGLLLSGRW